LREVWLVIALSALVVVPRSVLVSIAHNEAFDDACHVQIGLEYWSGTSAHSWKPNDPAFGSGLLAAPLWLAGCKPSTSMKEVLYGQPIAIETVLLLVAVWKALLFLPLVGVAFAWTRSLYGSRAAWLTAGLLVVDPNFAGHVPIAALDTLVSAAVLIAVFLAWRYFLHAGWKRLVTGALALAVALSIKHTAGIAAAVWVAFAILYWLARPIAERRPAHAWAAAVRRGATATIGGTLVLLFSIWALTLFDVSRPVAPQDVATAPPDWTTRALPAGTYLQSLRAGLAHNEQGHPGYLWGEMRSTGWWYYFPVLCTYKIPVPTAVLMILGAASLLLLRSRPRWDETGLVAALVIGVAFMLSANINTGFRHFLPVYAFLFPLAGRVLRASPSSASRVPRWRLILAWTGVALTFLHGVSYHPDYASYLNFPRRAAHLEISGSNIDWGQSLKRVGPWLDQHLEGDERAVVMYFGRDTDVQYHLQGRAVQREARAPLPRRGLLIISPTLITGQFFPGAPCTALRNVEPDDTIAHSLLVYDMDRVVREHPQLW
jgi:hypothetical protein